MDNNPTPSFEGPSCPLPLAHTDQIILGHGSGGRLTHELIQKVFKPFLDSAPLDAGNDFADLLLPAAAGLKGSLAVSTDSHIVDPLFFPGGDIGRLAVCGTVNDIAVSGAIPLFLTAGFILEEGFPVSELARVLESMRSAAQEAGVIFVAGDTKVAEKGKADRLFINTTGIGWIPSDRSIRGQNAQIGDEVIISGPIGDHGMAVLTARGDLGLESEIRSDVAPLNHMIAALLVAAPHVHVLRDPTRGGLGTTLNEIAGQSAVCIEVDETAVPVNPPVQTACDMLGFDPLYIANEGKVIVIVPPNEAEAALQALHAHPYGAQAALIGRVTGEMPGRVLLRTWIGGTRILEMLAGEILPRIC